MKKVAVILSGCGVYDGAEIHESVLTLLALDKAGAQAVCVAPDIDQLHVINHLSGEAVQGEKRNVLTESARIARGKVQPLTDLNPADIDAVILPGGYGAAKNLCNFGTQGADFSVEPSVEAFIKKAHELGKPLGFICIAPAIASRIFGEQGLKFTIGTDAGTADALQKNGAQHVDCAVDDIVVDESLKVVTTPAYMLAQSISQAEAGITRLVEKVLTLS